MAKKKPNPKVETLGTELTISIFEGYDSRLKKRGYTLSNPIRRGAENYIEGLPQEPVLICCRPGPNMTKTKFRKGLTALKKAIKLEIDNIFLTFEDNINKRDQRE